MFQFIKNFFQFFLYAILFYIVAIILFGEYNLKELNKNLNYRRGSYGHMFSRIQDINKADHLDVLVVGSSHAYRGFDPRIFNSQNINLFNLGSNIQTPVQTKFLLEKYLDRLKPSTVIFEVFPEVFKSDGIESTLDIISNDKIELNTFKMVLQINHLKVYNSFIFAYYRQFFGLDNNFVEEKEKDGDKYVKGGYVEKLITNRKEINLKVKPRNISFHKSQLKAFTKIVEILKVKKIKLILVQAPVTSYYYNNIENKQEIDSLFSQYGLYYNFNGKLKLSDNLDFYDSNHLNQTGVEKFNKVFLNYYTQLNYEH
jgi:hypothetical protein